MSDKLQGGVKAGSTSVSLSFVIRKASDSTELTGKVAADMTLSYWRQGGVRVAVVPTNLTNVNDAFSSTGVKEVDSTNMPGAYRVDWPDAAFATGADWVEFAVVVSGAFVYHERVPLTTNVIQTGDAFARVGAPAGASISADVAAIKSDSGTTLTDVVAIKAKTDNLPAAPADESLIITATNAIFNRLGAPAGSSVSADIAAVKSDTGTTLTDAVAIKAKTDNLPGSPAAISDIPTANANADALLDRANGIETGLTLRQCLRLVAAVLFGKASGMDTTTGKFRDVNDTKDRITVTDDANGNRTAVTRDAT